eukprot:TRINITY_DN391_c2_g1_i1.p1 TRINITY_DN391_c2_g1~~TRINITY_DN391_c2_g1_i1.p1  ORF type:complete len:464 (+),score=112.84 TRINITY_DN391_c2_g1_i1:162-1394(+)
MDGCVMVTDAKVGEALIAQLDKYDSAVGDMENTGRKPPKTTPLLRGSMTDANGGTWLRQRPLVLRALGGIWRPSDASGKVIAAGAKETAGVAAVRAAGGPADGAASWEADARVMGVDVACAALGRALGGRAAGAEVTAIAVDGYERNLLSKKKTPEEIAATRRAFEGIAAALQGADDAAVADDPSLFRRLVAECAPDGLAPEEVVGNAFSGLLAGTQAAAVTLACTLLHLAARPDLQDALASGSEAPSRATMAKVVKETLRVHPPVGALPRVALQGVSNAATEEAGRAPDACHVFANQSMEVDLVGCAHRGGEASWKWDPENPKPRAADGSRPFGMGPRGCPGSRLSVVVVETAVQALLDAGLRWTLAPGTDPDWVPHINYRPTLELPDAHTPRLAFRTSAPPPIPRDDA